MGKKLTIAHLAPYLPYGLELQDNGISKFKLTGVYEEDGHLWAMRSGGTNYNLSVWPHKPLLRPLSDLKKEMTHPSYYNGEPFTPIYHDFNGEVLDMDLDYSIDTGSYTSIYVSVLKGYQITQTLLEWHFDVFNLIEQGLALPK